MYIDSMVLDFDSRIMDYKNKVKMFLKINEVCAKRAKTIIIIM